MLVGALGSLFDVDFAKTESYMYDWSPLLHILPFSSSANRSEESAKQQRKVSSDIKSN